MTPATRRSATAPRKGRAPSPRTARPRRYDGPAHNEIPEPDRSKDNSTLWKANYNRAHYENMYFNRLDTFFKDQSSGKYRINGDVTEWVKVPFNEARYGRDYCGSIVCNNTWFLLRDGLAQWTQDRLDAGMTHGADPGLPEDVRRAGPLRLRRRRQLQGAGRLHRPHADRARGRRPGRRRPDLRHGRDLERTAGTRRSTRASLRPGRRRPAGRHRDRRGRRVRPERRQRADPGQPDRRLGRRLHHPARERWPQRLRARVRPRPRPARPLRHLRQHRWRREQRRACGR